MNKAKEYFRLLCLVIFLLSSLSACGDNNKIAVNDLTAHIERLGNPYQSRYKDGADVYARNIWDMQTYQGRFIWERAIAATMVRRKTRAPFRSLNLIR